MAHAFSNLLHATYGRPECYVAHSMAHRHCKLDSCFAAYLVRLSLRTATPWAQDHFASLSVALCRRLQIMEALQMGMTHTAPALAPQLARVGKHGPRSR